MKYLIFIFSISLLFVGCKEDPEAEKQKKLDEAADNLFAEMKPDVEKIVGALDSINDYSERLRLPKVQEYRRSAEKLSQGMVDEYKKLLPHYFRYIKPLKSEKFTKLEELLLILEDGPFELSELYEKGSESGDFQELEDSLQKEVNISQNIIKVLDGGCEWYFKSFDDPINSLSKLRRISKALKYATLLEAHKGNFEKVKKYFKASHLYSKRCEKIKGPLIVNLVSSAINGLTSSITYELVEKDLLTSEQFRELLEFRKSLIGQVSFDYAYMISVELYRDILWCAMTKSGQFDYLLLDLSSMTVFDDNPDETLNFIKTELEKGDNFKIEEFIKLNVSFYEALNKDFINKPPVGKLLSQKAFDELVPLGVKSLSAELRRLTLKHNPMLVKKHNFISTKYELCDLLLSIKIYEKEQGELPDNLEALKGKIPKDYNTGLPVKYNKENRAVIIKAAHGSDIEIKF